MARAATSRLKVNPPLGRRPSLENCRIGELNVDSAYQRSTDNGSSLTLIRKIAMFWDWSLFHPLAVSRRADGSLWVVDGQHRLEAGRLRHDMHDLPCVVMAYDSTADEAASFVAMNVQRKALNALDLFNAALAAGDDSATEIMGIISAAGLSLAPHSNYTAWKPGMVSNIAGIRNAFRSHGPGPVSAALGAFAVAFPGQVLRYGGSIFGGVVRCYARLLPEPDFSPSLFLDVLARRSQKEWVAEFLTERGRSGNNIAGAGEVVLMAAYRARRPSPLPAPPPRPAPVPVKVAPPKPDADGKRFCSQCDRRVTVLSATLCRDKFCKVQPALASAH